MCSTPSDFTDVSWANVSCPICKITIKEADKLAATAEAGGKKKIKHEAEQEEAEKKAQ